LSVKILVVEDDKDIRDLLRTYLAMQGFEILMAADGEEALHVAQQEQPHLVLLDLMLPGIDGYEVCRRLRHSIKTANIPIIMLTARGALPDKLTGFEIGADDYITKPFDAVELLARVKTQLRHVEQALLSDLTGLPGNTATEQVIKRLTSGKGEKWAILYVDIDNFKSYNDVYGFLKGNEIIKAAARILSEVVAEKGSKANGLESVDFIGHIGGDDFVVTTTPDKVDAICQEIVRRFDAAMPQFYSKEDWQRGYIIAEDRRGQVVRHPIATLSIGVVTNQFRPIDNYWLVSKIAAEVKQKAKSEPGSSYYVDRRR
jgi:diguanylate cyclase (GGDEF)-like protein